MFFVYILGYMYLFFFLKIYVYISRDSIVSEHNVIVIEKEPKIETINCCKALILVQIVEYELQILHGL